LPAEKQGGDGGWSLINDEQVQKASQTYLSSLPAGEVTPNWFQHTLNERILPLLRYVLWGRLSEHMAWWWLVKMGWW